MNKGNLEADLRAELAAWREPAAQVEPFDYDPDYNDPEYLDMIRCDQRDEKYDLDRDYDSAELEALDYGYEQRLKSDAEFWFAQADHLDDLVRQDDEHCYSALPGGADEYDWLWDDSDEDWWQRRDNDEFAHDATLDDMADHYRAIWAAVGYIPRYVPFPYPVRAVVDEKLVECYRL